MRECEQTEGQSILQHGESVWEHTKKLILGQFDGFKLPQWFLDNHHFIVNNLCKWDIIKTYNTFHDCGKPFCIEHDIEGKKHFPNHTEVSKQKFLEACAEGGEVAELIGLDMLFHTSNWEEIQEQNFSINTLVTLLVTSFAEIHSNARLFGGLESTNFKIKYKKLDRIGRKVIDLIPKHEDSYSYVAIRQDLPLGQKVVQSCHAVWEGAKGQHPSIISIVVKNETKLRRLMEELLDNDIQFSIFREPLLNNTITAICTEPLTDKKDLLKRYMLLS